MKSKRIAFLATFLMVCYIIALFSNYCEEDTVTIDHDRNHLVIEGSYGEEIELKNILEITLVPDKPKLKIRSNGFGFGRYQKGYYKTEKNELIKLNQHNKRGPYIQIKSQDALDWYINLKEKEQTESKYEELNEYWTSLSTDNKK